MNNQVARNSEILFIYEASLCNPNGDPDNENKPRIDPVTLRNYVTDVRLKRFFRDYVIERFGEKYIWVTTIGGENKRAEERLEKSMEEWNFKDTLDVTRFHIDARIFGATIPVKEKGRRKGREASGEDALEEGGEPISRQVIGPVQFSIGYSLHRVDLMLETSTITSRFVGAEKQTSRQHGTIGRDWRVYYSLIAFHGAVSALRGRATGLRENDIQLLDNIIWESLTLETNTRSKIGHYPHLYLRVEYNDDLTFLGDFRRHIEEDFESENIRKLEDLKKISFEKLIEVLNSNKSRVKTIYIRESDEFRERFGIKDKLLEKKFNVVPLPHNIPVSGEELIIKGT